MGRRANPLRDAAAIVGIGQTEFAKQIDRPEGQLAAEAVVAALRDAGIAPAEVDGLSSFTMESTDEVTLAKTIGAGDITYFSQVGYGGGAGCATIGHAAMAIATGQADVVVAWRSRKRGARTSRPWAAAPSRLPIPGAVDQAVRAPAPGRRGGHARPPLHVRVRRGRVSTWPRWRWPCGRTPTATRRRCMHDKPMSLDDYMAPAVISEPLCLFDNCLETDGALAAVLVSAERAKDCPHPPALVHAFGQGLHRQHESMVNYYCDDPLTGPAWACAEKLWSQSAIGPEEIDVAQIYDAFTPLILLSLEGYGFCKRGEAPDFVGRREPALGHRVAADQHVGRRALGGVRARVQPHHRGGAPAAWHLDQPGGRRARPASSPPARACPRAPSSCGRRERGRGGADGAAGRQDRLGPLHGVGELRVLGARDVRPERRRPRGRRSTRPPRTRSGCASPPRAARSVRSRCGATASRCRSRRGRSADRRHGGARVPPPHRASAGSQTHCPPEEPRAVAESPDAGAGPAGGVGEDGRPGVAGAPPRPRRSGGEGFTLAEVAVVLEELGHALFPGPVLPTLLVSAVAVPPRRRGDAGRVAARPGRRHDHGGRGARRPRPAAGRRPAGG